MESRKKWPLNEQIKWNARMAQWAEKKKSLPIQ